MTERFYKKYCAYLQNRFGSDLEGITNWPKELVYRDMDENLGRKINKPKPEYKFMLGSIAHVLCYDPDDEMNQAQPTPDLNTAIEFANRELFEEEKSFDEAKRVLHDIAKEVETIRLKYRNPSAHKDSINKASAAECINYMIEVERIMVKILNYLKV